jgi:hypothetical protein
LSVVGTKREKRNMACPPLLRWPSCSWLGGGRRIKCRCFAFFLGARLRPSASCAFF